jgi:hypothetical protein
VAKRNGQILRTPRKRHKTGANVTLAPVSPDKYVSKCTKYKVYAKCHVAKRNGQILRTPRKRNKTSANVTLAPVSPVKYMYM